MLVAGVLLAGLVLIAGVAVAASWPGAAPARERARPGPVADRSLVAPRAEVLAAEVLAGWDRRRAEVWASGARADLAALYVRGSAAGRRDTDMLASWRARGLRVEGLQTQVLALTLVDRGPGRLELEVVDRVVAGTAVGPGVRRPLPRDAPSARRVVLRDGPAGWRVARVSAGPRPAPP